MNLSKLPRRVKVKEIIIGRTPAGKKPISWDERTAGVDQIRTTEGEAISLYSTGGQSTPAPGWEILLTKFDNNAFSWTLYGLPGA